jgi:hypothetical protein
MPMSYDQHRKFASKILEAEFFGAFITAIETRKEEQGLTQADLGMRTGREKTGISKLLSGPRNWMLSTVSDLTEALDLRFEFVLVDKLNPVRRFTSTGVQYDLTQTIYPDDIVHTFSTSNTGRITGIVWNPPINGLQTFGVQPERIGIIGEGVPAITFGAPVPIPSFPADESKNKPLMVA